MKPTEEIADQMNLELLPALIQPLKVSNVVKFIEAIQLDAMKEGMRRAAKCIEPIPGDCEYGMITHTDAENAILFAAEQLTEKDLCPEPTKNL